MGIPSTEKNDTDVEGINEKDKYTKKHMNEDKPQKARPKVHPTLTQYTEHSPKLSNKGDESISSEMMIDATRSTSNEYDTIIDDNKRNIATKLKGLYKGIDNSNDENKQNIHNVDLSPASENEKYPELANPPKNKTDATKTQTLTNHNTHTLEKLSTKHYKKRK